MWTALTVVVLLSVAGGSQASICAQDQVGAYESECVNALISKMGDTNAYWFGTDFALKCPEPEWTTTECYNTLGASLLGSSVTELANISTANIAQTVNVTYTVATGGYVGCDHAYTLTEAYDIPIDPLSGETNDAWNLRSLPTLSWTTDASKQYAFIMLDVAFNYIHAMYINIQGNDLTSGTAVREYVSPAIPYDMENLYLILIYEQTSNDMSGVNALTATLTTALDPRETWQLGDYTDQDGLTGPIAVNMVLAVKDEFSVQAISTSTGTINNCVPFVEEAYEEARMGEIRPWLPATPDLSVFLRVQFESSAAYSFDYCCDVTTYASGSFYLDPTDPDSEQLAGELRTDMTRNIFLEANVINPDPSTDFANKQYTLIEVAPDLPEGYTDFGNNDKPMALWLSVNNVVSSTGQLTITDELLSYVAAVPPTSDRQNYYFLLYEQTSTISLTDTSAYSNDSCGLPNRCIFDLNQFVSDYSLDLVGINWMAVYRDADRYCDFEDGLEESTVCGPTYSECSGAEQVAMSALWVVTGVAMSLLSRAFHLV